MIFTRETQNVRVSSGTGSPDDFCAETKLNDDRESGPNLYQKGNDVWFRERINDEAAIVIE